MFLPIIPMLRNSRSTLRIQDCLKKPKTLFSGYELYESWTKQLHLININFTISKLSSKQVFYSLNIHNLLHVNSKWNKVQLLVLTYQKNLFFSLCHMTWVQLQSIPSRQRGTKSNRPKLPPTMKGFKYQKARRILKNRVTSQHNSTSHPFYQFTIGGIKHSKTLGELDRKIFKPLCSMKSKHFSRFTQTLKTLKDEWTTHCIQLNMVNYSLYFPSQCTTEATSGYLFDKSAGSTST